jgi:cell wall-associated NlpC family hydrolase
MFTRQQIQDEARKMLGTRFKHQGRSPRAGLDCIGLVACIARALGAQPDDFLEYGRTPKPTVLLDRASRGMMPIEAEEARGGDVLLFWLRKRRDVPIPQHFGVMTDAGTIIHAQRHSKSNRGSGRVVEQPLDDYWRRRICGAYRLRGVAD